MPIKTPDDSSKASIHQDFVFDRALLDCFPTMVWCSDPGGNCVYYNGAFKDFTGNDITANFTAGWLGAIHPEDRGKCAHSLKGAIGEKVPLQMEYRLRRHDGEYRWVFDRSRPFEIAGKFAGFIGFCVDVTERRDMDASRRDMEEQVRLLTLATRDMVWNWDARTGRVIHNTAFSEVLGDVPGSLDATIEWWRQRVHSEDRERAMGALQNALSKEAPDVTSEYRIRRRNGTWISVDDRACIVRDSDGNVLRVLGAMRDISARKAAEQERERFVRILEATTDVVAMAHPNGEILHLNEAGRKLLGWPLTGPLLEHNLSQCHPDWANEIVFKEGIPAAIAEGAWNGETALQGADGHEIPMLQVVLAHPGPDGRVEFISTILRDISERKRAEVARIEESNRYDAAIRSSRQLLFDWNSFNGDVAYSGDLTHFFGYNTGEMSGGIERLRQLIHLDDLALFDAEIARVTGSREPFRLVFRVRRKDGREIVIDAKGHFFLDRRGHIGRMVGFFADITMERQAQDALELAHERLEQRVSERTAELARANTVIHDRALQQEAVARLGQRALSGMPRAELFKEAAAVVKDTLNVEVCSLLELSEDRSELTVAGGAGWPDEAIHNRIPAGPHSQSGYTLLIREPVISDDFELETRYTVSEAALSIGARSGLSVVVQTSATPFGVLCAMSVALRRFTQEDVHFLQTVANVLTSAINRQRAEQSIRLAQEQAESANRAKSEFLSRMSHELRTPLNAIIGFTQLLEMERLTTNQSESVSHIARGGEHLLALINQVLDIARIDTGRMTLSIAPVEIAGALRESAELIQGLADRHGVTVHLEIEKSCDICVSADAQRLQQVFMNLLSNAVKYNRPGGSVNVSAEQAENRVRVRFRDTGIGIPAEKMNRLFIPFERLGAEQTQVEGTGIGLALAQRIVSSNNGILSVESTPGEGSTFTVDLPGIECASTPAEKPPAQPEEDDSSGAAPRKILYIEDQDMNLRLVERILKLQPGLKLISAMQGSLGIDLAREHRPDVILLDLNLPDMSGDEVLRRLKIDESLRGIPVIMVSADALGDRITQLIAQGAHGYITKPYKVADFLRVVNETLEAFPR